MSSRLLVCFAIFVCAVWGSQAARGGSMYARVRGCLGESQVVLCLKEEVLDLVNDTLTSEQPVRFFDSLDVEKDPAYKMDFSDDQLPKNVTARSVQVDKLLLKKMDQFIQSRSLKINLSDAVEEGRKKKGGKGGHNMLMMGGLAMGAMMTQLFMGKIAFLAGTALMIAKMALLLSLATGLKKLVGGGGGGESHVVYAQESHGGGGGWHRSLEHENHAHNMAYSGYAPQHSEGQGSYTNYNSQ